MARSCSPTIFARGRKNAPCAAEASIAAIYMNVDSWPDAVPIDASAAGGRACFALRGSRALAGCRKWARTVRAGRAVAHLGYVRIVPRVIGASSRRSKRPKDAACAGSPVMIASVCPEVMESFLPEPDAATRSSKVGKGPHSPTAEAGDLKSLQSGFESQWGHRTLFRRQPRRPQ